MTDMGEDREHFQELTESFVEAETTEPNDAGVSEGSILIRAGMNAPGRRYYTPAFLQEHMGMFDGSLMRLDHPSRTEKADRPEGSLGKLAAVVEQPSWDVQEQAVRGDIHYITTTTGNEVKAMFGNPRVRERAGLSIHWSGGYDAVYEEREGRRVEVPTSLDESGTMYVDFVTQPTAGGEVTEIREEDDRDMDWEDMTEEQLRENCPDLIAEIEESAQAQVREEDEDEEPEEEPEPEEDVAESDLRRENAELRASIIVRDVLGEADLPQKLEDLIESDFEGATCDYGADGDFRGEVETRIDVVKTALQESGGARVTGAMAESDRDDEPVDVMASVRRLAGAPDEDE